MGAEKKGAMENFVWSFLSATIVALCVFLIQRKFQNQERKQLENLKDEFRSQNYEFLTKLRLNYETQFKVYNELWAHLTELEIVVEELWSKDLTPDGVRALAKAVNETYAKVKEAALIIDEQDLVRLRNILHTLMNYKAGTQKLLALEEINEDSTNEIQQQIYLNFNLRSEYVELKLQMLSKMRQWVQVHN